MLAASSADILVQVGGAAGPNIFSFVAGAVFSRSCNQ